jgi:hypothetical protein
VTALAVEADVKPVPPASVNVAASKSKVLPVPSSPVNVKSSSMSLAST